MEIKVEAHPLILTPTGIYIYTPTELTTTVTPTRVLQRAQSSPIGRGGGVGPSCGVMLFGMACITPHAVPHLNEGNHSAAAAPGGGRQNFRGQATSGTAAAMLENGEVLSWDGLGCWRRADMLGPQMVTLNPSFAALVFSTSILYRL